MDRFNNATKGLNWDAPKLEKKREMTNSDILDILQNQRDQIKMVKEKVTWLILKDSRENVEEILGIKRKKKVTGTNTEMLMTNDGQFFILKVTNMWGEEYHLQYNMVNEEDKLINITTLTLLEPEDGYPTVEHNYQLMSSEIYEEIDYICKLLLDSKILLDTMGPVELEDSKVSDYRTVDRSNIIRSSLDLMVKLGESITMLTYTL